MSSTIKLTAFAIFKVIKPKVGEKSIETLYGASHARFTGDGRVELLATSVPFHSDAFKTRVPKAGAGTLMLYGTRDTVDELGHWRRVARDLGAEFACADFEFDVGTMNLGVIDRDVLMAASDLRFVNFRRLKAADQVAVLNKFKIYADLENFDLEDMRRVSQIATRPDFFDRFFQEDRAYKDVDVLVVPVADDPAIKSKIRQLAYVRPGSVVRSVVQLSDIGTMLLPSWMNSRAAGKSFLEKQAVAA